MLAIVTKEMKRGLLKCVASMIFINELMGISNGECLISWDLLDGIEQTENLKEHIHGKLAAVGIENV